MHSAGPDRPVPPAREHERIQELEHALAELEAERRLQADVVETELSRLNRIYDRLRTDLAAAREERDRALDQARDERERRTRETRELSEQLEQAVRLHQEQSSQSSRDAFVKARLASAVHERRALADDELPEIPGFEIRGRLGRGGMATVYRALRISDGTEVALKLLRHGAEAARNRTELFLREAAVMLELEHPNLVRALDAGECAYGLYLVLELIEGRSLSAVLRERGPLSEDDAVKIGVQVARALAFCAKLELTHRDVKPSNLLVDRDGRVKLCDFGLTALAGDQKSRPYGSPGYAAPEQLARPLDVDERVDMYALGCTLWHLVVGRRAFPGKPREAFDLQKKLDLPDPRFEGADVSSGFAQTLRRMGRRDPGQRYRRWESCLLDLMLVQRGNPPFAAHLAEALQPGAGERGELADGGVGVPDRSEPPSDASDSQRVLPADTGVGPATDGNAAAADVATGDESVEVPEQVPLDPFARRPAAPPPHVARSRPPRAEPMSPRSTAAPPRPRSSRTLQRLAKAFAALALAGLALSLGHLGWTLNARSSTRAKPTPTELEDRARELAAEGRAAEAAASLRSAAELLPPEQAEKLRALADELSPRDSAPGR